MRRLGAAVLDRLAGMNLREAIQVAREIGCTVEDVRRTGELRVQSPHLAHSCKFNRRRKDAPRALIGYLRRAIAEAQRGASRPRTPSPSAP